MLKIQAFTVGPIETNCYLAYDSESREAILIDPAAYDKEIVNFIKDNNLNVRFTVNTHGHYDHIGGDMEFVYPVLIHEKDREFLLSGRFSLAGIVSERKPLRNVAFKAERLLKDEDIIRIKDISFKVIHLPGHTPGSIGLECGKVIFTGDTLFFGGVGRIDLPLSNDRDLKRSLKRLMQYSDDTVIYPGHGPSSTIGHERECNPFIRKG